MPGSGVRLPSSSANRLEVGNEPSRGATVDLLVILSCQPLAKLQAGNERHILVLRGLRQVVLGGSPEHDDWCHCQCAGLLAVPCPSLGGKQSPSQTFCTRSCTPSGSGHLLDVATVQLVSPLGIDRDHASAARHDDMVDVADLEGDAVDPS